MAQLADDDTGEHKVNRDVFAALCRCGIEVRIDLNPDNKIFHHKFALATSASMPTGARAGATNLGC